MTAGDSASATVFVAVAPAVAFDVFTREFSRMIGLWWGELMSSLREHLVGRSG